MQLLKSWYFLIIINFLVTVKRYEELEEIKRLNRKPKSYKITKEQVKYAIQKLKENKI